MFEAWLRAHTSSSLRRLEEILDARAVSLPERGTNVLPRRFYDTHEVARVR